MSLPRALARAQQVIQNVLTVEAIVQRKTRTGDSAGGATESFVDHATYMCSFSSYPVRSLEREFSSRVQAVSYWQFIFPFDADVRITDRIKVGTRTFEVTGGGLSSVPIDLRVLAVEIL